MPNNGSHPTLSMFNYRALMSKGVVERSIREAYRTSSLRRLPMFRRAPPQPEQPLALGPRRRQMTRLDMAIAANLFRDFGERDGDRVIGWRQARNQFLAERLIVAD